MTEFKVEYRGVEVPAQVLTGLFGGATLEAFKLGVDAALGLPEPEYDYYSDEDTDGNEWIWRFRKGGGQVGELLREYDPVWIESHSDRSRVESEQTKITTLPDWAREAGH